MGSVIDMRRVLLSQHKFTTRPRPWGKKYLILHGAASRLLRRVDFTCSSYRTHTPQSPRNAVSVLEKSTALMDKDTAKIGLSRRRWG